MAKANGLDADNRSVNTLKPCIFALAKHGMDPVDKWSTKTIKSLFELKCQTEAVTDKSKNVQVENGFTGRDIESLDILQNIPNLLSFVFPGKEMTGLYLSPKTCSYPVDDWQVGHISLFDALDDALHCHCIICFGQNNYFVAFRSQESQQTNTRKSLSSAKPKVWLFDGDIQHEAHLTSHIDEKAMRTYITELLKKHNQSSQQNVQIRMCAHKVSLRYQMKKGVLHGHPSPSFPVPRFKTEPLLVIVVETLVNKKCTMVDVKSTQFHSVISAEEKLQANHKLKAMQKGNKIPYQVYSPRINQIATLPAPIRAMTSPRTTTTTTKYPSVLTVSQGKVSLSSDSSKSAQSQIPEIQADKKVHNQPFANDTTLKKKDNQITASIAEAAKKAQDETASQKEGNKKGQIQTSVSNTVTKKAQNQTASNTMEGQKDKDATAEVSNMQRGAVMGLSTDKGANKKAVSLKTNAATIGGIGSKSRPTGIKDCSIMPVVLVENIAKAASPENKKDMISLIITDVKSLAKNAKVSHSGPEKRKRSHSPESQPEANTRLTRSMRRSLQPSENSETKASTTTKPRRSLNVTKTQSEKGRKSHLGNNNKSKIEKNYSASSNDSVKSNVNQDANSEAPFKDNIESKIEKYVKGDVDGEDGSNAPIAGTSSASKRTQNSGSARGRTFNSAADESNVNDAIDIVNNKSEENVTRSPTASEENIRVSPVTDVILLDVVNDAIAKEYKSEGKCTKTAAATAIEEDGSVSPVADVEMRDDTCCVGEDKSSAEEEDDNSATLTEVSRHARTDDDVEMRDVVDEGHNDSLPQPQEQQQTEVDSSNTTTTATATTVAVAAGDFTTRSEEDETETSSFGEKQNVTNLDEDIIEGNGTESPTLSDTAGRLFHLNCLFFGGAF